jgi:16S rRNA processing protein RimM
VKTQGRHGEVAVEVHSDVPDRFAAGMKLFALRTAESGNQKSKSLAKAEGARQPPAESTSAELVELEIEDLWPHKGLLVLKFQGVDSISDAEALVGAELQVPSGERAELEPGWTYVSDLIGCTVFDHDREIGKIVDVQFGAGEAPLLIVTRAGGAGGVTKAGEVRKGGEVVEYAVPFAEAYLVSVDAVRREVRMDLPEGMLEINAPTTAEEKRQQGNVGRKKKY